MFHIGHLNLLNQAKELCDYLIVGVNSDDLVEVYKHKKTVIHQEERCAIVSNIKAVDECIIVDTLDKVELWQKLHFEAAFVGDDWKGNARWLQTEQDLNKVGADVVYLQHTPGVSSTILRPEQPMHVEE